MSNTSELIDMTTINIEVNKIIYTTFNIDTSEVNDQLKYSSIPNWDSFGHIQLIMSLEDRFKVTIHDDYLEQLTSVKNIKEFIFSKLNNHDLKSKEENSNNTKTVHRGLKGVVYDYTQISSIKGKEGKLFYRGYNIKDLVKEMSYEQVSFLLIKGYLPSAEELTNFKQILKDKRNLSSDEIDLIYKCKDQHPIEMLRTMISFLSSEENVSKELAYHNQISLISKIPLIIATFQNLRTHGDYRKPSSIYNHTENFLYMLNGTMPDQYILNIVEKSFILLAEHGSNASTFASRIVASTQGNLYSAITSAISAFSGPLHGGAAEKVMEMLEEIQNANNVDNYIETRLKNNEPIMGYGHRIYKKNDPRAEIFKDLLYSSELINSENEKFKIITRIAEVMGKFESYGIGQNVDFYMGFLFSFLNIPKDILGVIFVSSRISGWIAHINEQKENNILLRPSLEYVGTYKSLG